MTVSDSQNQTPRWMSTARAHIKEAKEYLSVVQSAGQADIRRGLETVRATDKPLQQLSYLEQVLDQRASPSVWNDEIVHITGSQLSANAASVQSDAKRLAGLCGERNQTEQARHMTFISAINMTATSSGSMVYLGAQMERRLQTITPSYRPVFEFTKPELFGSRQKIYDELTEILNLFDPKYLDMLKGSETALYGTTEDHLSQAAHSMRDLFQQLMEHLAPTDAVKQQPWFKPTPGAPDQVSRMSRLKYILYGSGEMLNEFDTKRLDEVADGAKTSLDLAIARAHDHDPDLAEADVELAIDYARFSLLEVLKERGLRPDGVRPQR